MATVKEITHDSSTTLSDFYTTITDIDGALAVTPGSALDGSVNGLDFNASTGANVPILLEPFAAITGNEIRFRARINIDNISSFSAGNAIMNLNLRNSVATTVFRVILNANAGGTGAVLTLFAETDVGTTVIGANTVVPSGDTCFEIKAIRETADGNNDGVAVFFVGNSLAGSATNIQNFNLWAADGGMQELQLTFGPLQTGNLYYDEFILDDDSNTVLGCSTVLTLSPVTKPASIDASGTFVYVALLNGGTPILTKFSTALDSDGTTVFDPGAGDGIGVECGRFDANVIWIAGQFDGTNAVEKSEDAGTSFVVKDNGFSGSVFAFSVGPDSDDRVIVDDNDANIQETIDSGATWIIRNPDGFNGINSFVRLGKNVQETVIGQLADVTDTIDYSINSGTDLEDFQTGVFPSADVTGVIVN